jgi:DNA-directed RNA polymerase specialized sigma24 family protein
VPSESLIAYAHRLVRRQYQVRVEDADDVIAEALLDFVREQRRGRPCGDGLFLVIVRRRACDFWRGRRREVPLGSASSVACRLDDRHLLEEKIQERLLRLSTARSRLHRRRLLSVTKRIFEGATFSEACRASGIPRGSHGRYRLYLRSLLLSVGLDSPQARL